MTPYYIAEVRSIPVRRHTMMSISINAWLLRNNIINNSSNSFTLSVILEATVAEALDVVAAQV